MSIFHLTTHDHRDVVYPLDPAIDPESSDYEAYGKTLDMACLRFKELASPVVFTIRPLTGAELRRCKQRACVGVGAPVPDAFGRLLGERHEQACLGVVAVRGVPGRGRVDCPKGLPRDLADALDPEVSTQLGWYVERISNGDVAQLGEIREDDAGK